MGEIGSKVSDNSGLVNKTDYNPKISNSEGKYFTTSNYDEFTKKKKLDAKIKEKWLLDDWNIANFVKNSNLKKNRTILATKAESKAEQDKVVKFQLFDSNYFRGKSHLKDDDIQKYLVFQPVLGYFKKSCQ